MESLVAASAERKQLRFAAGLGFHPGIGTTFSFPQVLSLDKPISLQVVPTLAN